jgi:hypothetical protein
MVFNTTFNTISFIFCRSVLLVEETGVYSLPSQSAKNNDIFINFMGRTKTKPFLKRKKGAEILLSLVTWAAKKVSSLLLLTHTR